MTQKIKTYVINLDCELPRYILFKEANKHMEDILDIEHLTPVSTNSKEVTEGLKQVRGRSESFKKRAEISNKLSMALALEKAYTQGFEEVIVLEDDAVFTKDAPGVLRRIMGNIPADMLSCHLGGYIKSFSSKAIDPIDKNLFRLRANPKYRLWGAHAILYNRKGMEVMIKTFRGHKDLADTIVVAALVKKGLGGMCFPFICNQSADSYSKIIFGTSMHGTFPLKKMESDNVKFINQQINNLPDNIKRRYDLKLLTG
jgi:GR25 family glycosyltransferase involved in LPS biosynthesis